MRRIQTKKRDLSGAGFLASVLVFLLIMGAFVTGSLSFSGKAEAEGEETLRSAIARAVVQCYAIEGRYPPSVEYLEENYGIQIDRERYYVFYEGFASNVMPDITVISAEKSNTPQQVMGH